ncbi:Lrp/AsnC family transcriptional regulator [Cognatishimia sp. 1_MG-2023]|uniref:Lrp/AsnC family transcriptional regulator n=1 Tax=Cognatishimia sp. 1_MG-2023 TaxID=3062642 RepID=UPI0026E349C7|nr:Lrp/AsnC family transcriptional regulator [Cognatishimia sp. 1_MG-2023]MDO6728259.1 Lrp/AsnC family transcriptional regulator [Cognatishimia sp. 1_MG-2023]
MPKLPKLDTTDRKMIRALQKNGRMTNLELAESVNLSPSPCLRRLRILEKEGVIRGYNVDVDATAYGLPITVFVRITLNGHTGDVVGQFEEEVNNIPEILECYVMTGGADYLLRVLSADLEDYERFVRERLHTIGHIRSIDTSFVYGVVKNAHVFPDIENRT